MWTAVMVLVLTLGPTMLRSCKLTSQPDRECFVAEYNRRSKTPIALAELERAMVRGFYQGDTLVAGYAVNASAPFRYLQIIPESAAREILEQLGAERICEGFALWADRSLGNSARVWGNIACTMDLLATRKKYILSGTIVPQLRDRQMKVLPHLLYEGVGEVDGVEHTGWTYYGTRLTMLRGLTREAGKRLFSLGIYRSSHYGADCSKSHSGSQSDRR